MQENYHPLDIEQRVQKLWEDQGVFKADDSSNKPKYYCLSMFPYPSGKLHMGHVRNYTIGDVISRYQRMLGKNVLQPMGWDAFGLPAENAAMQHGVHPADWTYSNIDYMREQLKRLGFGYDWDREIATCDPDYFKWEQWFFLKLLEKGLAYKKTAPVNWCPKDLTVLANEQVIDGCCWRCDTPVERKEISQWFLKITAYADELLNDLDTLDGWPEQVKTMQANWIGKSYGVRFAFPYQLDGKDELLWVYTTRADTIMGVTFCAVAAAHPLSLHAAETNSELTEFLKECEQSGTAEADVATMEKKGMPTGISVTHPLTGEQVPVWVGNYVLMSYGEGAVMAVPAHDERDFYFAKKYQLPIKQVIEARAVSSGGLSLPEFTTDAWEEWYADKQHGVCVNSGKYDGMGYQAAVDAISADLKAKNLGDKQVQYRLRDWGVSRQRYWGAPIPVIYCDNCGTVPVPEQDLPVTLPKDVVLDGSQSPLVAHPTFSKCKCPKCGKAAKRETDTFDTFMESSWYFARFASQPTNTMLDAKVKNWLPVDHYIGGIEHAILHLLYSRFYHKLLRDAGLVSSDEPFKKLLTQGMVIAETFYKLDGQGHKQYFNPAQVDVEHDQKGKVIRATLQSDGSEVIVGNVEKMAKSKNNGVDPQVMIDQYGADTVRLFIMFAAPPEQSLEWSESGVEGAFRFLKRLWRQVYQHVSSDISESPVANDEFTTEQQVVRRQVHQAIQKVTNDMGVRTIYNTAIAANMELLNTLFRFEDESANAKAVRQEALEAIVLMLSPIVPHICHQLWLELGHDEAVVNVLWPSFDESALVQDSVEYVLQVNGKLRGKMTISASATKSEIEQTALANDAVQKFIDGKPVRKIIVVPNKLVNIVI